MDYDTQRDINIATNGRLFLVMLFVANLSAFLMGLGQRHGLLAILCALPVGLAVLAEGYTGKTAPPVLALCVYLASAIIFLFTLASFW